MKDIPCAGSDDAALPDLPRLKVGCSVFEDEGRLVVRSTHGAFAIEPVHRPAMERVLAKLDGRHDFEALLGGEQSADAFYALRMLDCFAQSGLVADGPGVSETSAEPPANADVWLDGVAPTFSDGGRLAGKLSEHLTALGAASDPGSVAEAAAQGTILIFCPDGPDLAGLKDTNRQALEAGVTWLPVLPFGDAIVVGPMVRPGASPCWRCFELRWLGGSPAVALELAYWRHLERNGWHASGLTHAAAEALAPRIAAAVAPLLTGAAIGGHSGQAVLLSRETGPDSAMPIEQHPSCDACARPGAGHVRPGAGTGDGWFAPTPSLAATARALVPLANGRCGLVALMPPSRHQPRRFGLPDIAIARFAVPAPEDAEASQDNWCHGTAERQEDAEAIAVIEAIERYAGLSPDAVCLHAPYAAVAGRALLPTDLPLFSPAQYASPGFAFQQFDPQQPLDWSEGYNLTRAAPVLVPSAAAWYGQDDTLLCETSSGVAAHGGRGDALLNGALELIERDAFMIHWLNRLSPPLIDPGQIEPPATRALVAYVAQRGYTLWLADLTTELDIPVRLALGVRTDRQGPALIAGAGASLDPDQALDRALRELYAAISTQTPLWTLPPVMALGGVNALADHSLAYQHPDWLTHAAFLWADRERGFTRPSSQSAGSVDDLGGLIRRLDAHGHDVIGVDITPLDVARYGLHVVRAIIPGLQPLGFGNRIRLGGRRLYEAPVRMGCRAVPILEDFLNLTPHCFP